MSNNTIHNVEAEAVRGLLVWSYYGPEDWDATMVVRTQPVDGLVTYWRWSCGEGESKGIHVKRTMSERWEAVRSFDLIEFVAPPEECNVELAERWVRRRLAEMAADEERLRRGIAEQLAGGSNRFVSFTDDGGASDV